MSILLDRLWNQLNPEKQQAALGILASVIARQIVVPSAKEVNDENDAK